MASTVFVDGVTLSSAAWFQAVDNVAFQYLSGVSGTNTITATGPSGLGAYAAGLKFRFIPAVTNTGATTINITGTAALGARNIFFNGLALIGGELVAGIPIEIIDDGTRFQITGGTPPTRFLTIRKTADQSITSSTTLTDDSHLKFAIAANEEWWADIYLDAGASLNTTGIRLAVTTPAGATLNVWSELAASTTDQRTSTSGGSMNYGAALPNQNANGLYRVYGWYLNGATPGNITLQFCQDTNVGTATTLRRGSHMIAVRLA